MSPAENYYSYDPTNKRKMRIFIIIIMLAIILFIGFLVLSGVTSYKPPVIQSLKLANAKNVRIEGDYIYGFDGLSVSKTNLDSGKKTFLSKPLRLPKIDQIWYLGDSGALMTFNGSFDLTALDSYYYEHNLQNLDARALSQNFLWYLNYSTNTLSLVSEKYADWRSVYIDEKNPQQAYVIFMQASSTTRDYESDDIPESSLEVFDTTSLSFTKTYSAPDLVTISDMAACSSYIFCISGSQIDGSMALFGFKEGAYNLIHQTKFGSMAPTNNPRYYALYETSLSDKQLSNLSEDDSLFGPYKVDIINIETKSLKNTGLDIDELSGDFLYIDGETNLLLSSSNNLLSTSFKTKNIFGLNVRKSGTEIKDSLISAPTSYSSDGRIAFIKTTGGGILIGRGHTLPLSDKSYYSKVLSKCITPDESYFVDDSKAIITVTTPYTPNLQTSINRIGTCIQNNDTSLGQVQFSIVITSPTTGQIISQ